MTDGPYRYVRHPGYAATLGMWLGFGLALTSVPAAIVTTLPNITSYLWRIDVEEAMLVESFGESYRAYQRATWRLIPAVY